MYSPLIKKRGFFPNEISVNGIPDYANSAINPTIIGTVAHEEWWKEQLDRILNGYTTGGVFIPGRYYYYLNFILISTVGRGLHHPEFVDIDLEYFNFIELAKKENKGIICIKARRKGMSEKSKAILDYGIRFSNSGYKAGICAGQETYSEELFDKVKKVNKDLPKELQMHYLKDNAKELVCGYTEMTNTGEVSRGSLNTVICETMYNNPDIFKGNAFNDVIFEEAGQFDHLIAGYNATKACFMVGTKMVGTPYLYGCVCAGTKVWNNKGELLNIEDIKQEEGILGMDDKGISKEEIIHLKSPSKKPCYRITTNTGTELECSNDHPIMWSKSKWFYRRRKTEKGIRIPTGRFKKVEFRAAENIKKGEQICIINSVPLFGTKKIWEPRLIGWLIGDGTYGMDHSPRMSNCDKEINDTLLKKFDSKVIKSHLTKEGKIYEEIRLKGICGQLRELGIYGQTKDKKRLPKDIFLCDKESLCEIIGGLIDTDGYVGMNKGAVVIVFTSAYKNLILDIKNACIKIGVHGSISRIKANLNKKGKIKDVNDYYRFTIADDHSVYNFYKNVKLIVRYKQEALNLIIKNRKKSRASTSAVFVKNSTIDRGNKKIDVTDVEGMRFEMVKSIEYIGEQYVYNLTAGTTHTYIANNVVTHNTGGDIKSSSHDFRDMWLEADNYGLMKFEIMGPRMMVGYFGGSKNERGKTEEHIPNIKKLKDSNNNISGCEDIQEAEKVIMETRRELVKGRNKKKYYDYLQNYPLTDKEAFLTFSSNNFDSTILSNQGYAIDSSPTTPYLKYILEWVKNDDGSIKIPFAVKAKIADELESEDNIIFIRPGYTPIVGYKNLYVSGLDSYDQDSSQTSKSLGSMVVLIRDHMIPGLDTMAPIAMIRNRPKHKEIFYDNCLKLSIYYNLIGNTLVDIAKAAVIQYYKDKGCQKYLAPRPTSFESENSQQTHEFGVALTGLSKPRMVSLLQTFVAYNGHKIWFKHLIDDLLNYDQLQKDSDWDAADALGIALMRHTDINKKPIDLQSQISQDPYELTQYKREGGVLKPIVTKEKLNEISDPFLRMIALGKI